jgi:hypothetical protein
MFSLSVKWRVSVTAFTSKGGKCPLQGQNPRQRNVPNTGYNRLQKGISILGRTFVTLTHVSFSRGAKFPFLYKPSVWVNHATSFRIMKGCWKEKP